jgi:four helix bundle protein
MQDYKKLKVWGKAHELVIKVYKISEKFPRSETYIIKQQILRSAISIAANISEGCGKVSKKEFANFLTISLGSANETEYYLLLVKDLKFVTQQEHYELHSLVNEIKAMLLALIKKIRFESTT